MAERDKGTDCGTARGPQVTLPVIGLRLGLPRPERLAWYAGLGLMAAFELVDWELALIIGVGHLIEDTGVAGAIRPAIRRGQPPVLVALLALEVDVSVRTVVVRFLVDDQPIAPGHWIHCHHSVGFLSELASPVNGVLT